ncbi:MAG: AAA family ATPase [Chloroflexi bacterium]|nr:AAA family ATPase [Chloroflexota bacterium]
MEKDRPRPASQKVVVDDLDAIVATLPPYVQVQLRRQEDLSELLEVVLDLGRLPETRFPDRDVALNTREVTEEDLQYVVERIGHFGDDNRAGIPRTLHRMSAIRNRSGKIVGITCRVGRAVFGTVKVIEDMVLSGKNILLLGRPGVGKTTMLREVARILSEAGKRVIVVDTSNEIAGDGDIPHPAIGKARRMQVATPSLQHAVMIEAVENHMPQVIVIDEMGTELEAAAARTIAERGVQLIATAHGNTLENLVLNPTLSDLLGGVQTATLSDEEARRRGTQKTVLERKAPPTFDVVVEIQSWERVALHANVAQTVDTLLRGYLVVAETRFLDVEGRVHKAAGEPLVLVHSVEPQITFLPFRGRRYSDRREPDSAPAAYAQAPSAQVEAAPMAVAPPTRLYLFGVGRDKLLQGVQQTGSAVGIVADLEEADVILTTKAHYRRRGEALRKAEAEGKAIYVLRKNTPVHIHQFLRSLGREHRGNSISNALEEAEEAANKVMAGEPSVQLSPQASFIRRLQHHLADRYNLASTSQGHDPHRRVIIYRPE